MVAEAIFGCSPCVISPNYAHPRNCEPDWVDSISLQLMLPDGELMNKISYTLQNGGYARVAPFQPTVGQTPQPNPLARMDSANAAADAANASPGALVLRANGFQPVTGFGTRRPATTVGIGQPLPLGNSHDGQAQGRRS